MRNSVLVHPSRVSDEVTFRLRQLGCAAEVGDASSLPDYVCGGKPVILREFGDLDRPEMQRSLIARVQATKRSWGGCIINVIVRMPNASNDGTTVAEPSLSTLSWLNIECTVGEQCALALCWSVEEVAQFLVTLSSAAAMSVDFSAGRQKEDAPLPILIDAFTQTPQILSRADVLRIANRVQTVADVLSGGPDLFADIPGMGPRKVVRLHSLLNIPFPTSQQRIADVLPSSVPSATINERERMYDAVPASTTSSARLAMNEVIQRMRDAEDEFIE